MAKSKPAQILAVCFGPAMSVDLIIPRLLKCDLLILRRSSAEGKAARGGASPEVAQNRLPRHAAPREGSGIAVVLDARAESDRLTRTNSAKNGRR
jgi:hypothetical protein